MVVETSTNSCSKLRTLDGQILVEFDTVMALEIWWYHTCLPPLRSAVQDPDPMWESWKLLTNGHQFTVQNFGQLYLLVSSAHKTTRH